MQWVGYDLEKKDYCFSHLKSLVERAKGEFFREALKERRGILCNEFKSDAKMLFKKGDELVRLKGVYLEWIEEEKGE